MKAYPTPEQQCELLDLQRRLRRLWNWLVSRSENTRQAREAFAARNGAGPRPERPSNDAGENAWKEFKLKQKEWWSRVREVLSEHKDDPGLQFRNVKDYVEQFKVKHDYQLYPHIFDLEDGEKVPCAHVQQALFEAYKNALSATKRGASPPQFKKRDQDVLLQTGSGKTLRLGRFGPRPGCPNGRSDWLNAQINIPGVGWISCRLGPDQPLEESTYWMEGVSLRLEADGWYAAIRQHVVPKQMTRGTGICAIDVGLVNLFAVVGDDDEILLASNPRRGESMKRRRHTPHGYMIRQAADMPVSKLQARAARNVRQIIREHLFPFTDRYEFILVEDLPSDIGFQNTPHLSFMRTIRTMLIQRYGSERVIDVDPTGTSRTCSNCGDLQPRSWSSLPGRVGTCKSCGYVQNSDVNAARNLLSKYSKRKAS